MSNHKTVNSGSSKSVIKQFTQAEEDARTSEESQSVVDNTQNDWNIEKIALEAKVHESIEELLIWAKNYWNLTYPPKITAVLAAKAANRANEP